MLQLSRLQNAILEQKQCAMALSDPELRLNTAGTSQNSVLQWQESPVL